MHIHNVTHLDTLGTEKLRTLISDFRASRIHIHMYMCMGFWATKSVLFVEGVMSGIQIREVL